MCCQPSGSMDSVIGGSLSWLRGDHHFTACCAGTHNSRFGRKPKCPPEVRSSGFPRRPDLKDRGADVHDFSQSRFVRLAADQRLRPLVGGPCLLRGGCFFTVTSPFPVDPRRDCLLAPWGLHVHPRREPDPTCDLAARVFDYQAVHARHSPVASHRSPQGMGCRSFFSARECVAHVLIVTRRRIAR